MSLLHNPRERVRFAKFFLVGAVGALIDFGLFNLLNRAFGVPEVLAQALSFSTAVTSNFILNRRWTYPDSRTKSLRRQWSEFFVVNAIGLGIRTPIFAMLEYPLQGWFETRLAAAQQAVFLSHNLALAVAVGIVMFWNFFVNRFWTYADVQ